MIKLKTNMIEAQQSEALQSLQFVQHPLQCPLVCIFRFG